MPIAVRTDNVRAHADMNIVHPNQSWMGEAYKHIPGTSTVAMFKTTIANLPDSRWSQT